MPSHGCYGLPPAELAALPREAVPFSPLMPGAAALEEAAPGSLEAMAMLAPPGTLERRYALALGLRALAPGGALTALAPKDKGGARLGKELRALGCDPQEEGRRHYRICRLRRPDHPLPLDDALAEGAPRRLESGLWSQPGIFSWDRLDPGSALLMAHLPKLAGRGADLGCGIGTLANAVLASPAVQSVALIDIDRRAVEAARHNVDPARSAAYWADLRHGVPVKNLDFIVMNPPFHDTGIEDRGLGQRFIERAAEMLRSGGSCWLTANRHLPYEAVLSAHFSRVTTIAEDGGYKIIEARK